MFLPIVLLRDFGVWGWVAFAVPNVLGAAAMGFVLTPQRSRAVTERHREACLRFSDVTLAFHGFVLGWLYSRLFGWGVVLIALAAVVGLAAALRDPRKATGLAVKVTLASLGLFACGLIFGGSDAWLDVSRPDPPHRLPISDIWFFVMASVTGFALCPYLDLTFHRARQQTTLGAGRVAFAVGFGVIFLTMIVFTLAYAGMLQPLFDLSPAAGIAIPTQWLAVLMIHLTLQCVFTMSLHSREILAHRGEGAWLRTSLVVAAGVLLAVVAQRAATGEAPLRITTGETVYRCFLLAYGLAFPGYVFLCMIPLWFGKPSMLVRYTVWVLATLVALPFGYVGFVMLQTPWIAGALLVLCVGRFLLELQSRVADAPPPSPSGRGPG